MAASLELFAQHGVGGTSLQMIAEELGVTKAAVYHQFNTKDAIVIAAAENELARVEMVLDEAEAKASPTLQRDALLEGIVDLCVRRRATVSVILSDPVVLRAFATHEQYQSVVDRFTSLLWGPDPAVDGHLRTVMFMAALSGAVMHPLLADLDEELLRSQLLRLAQSIR